MSLIDDDSYISRLVRRQPFCVYVRVVVELPSDLADPLSGGFAHPSPAIERPRDGGGSNLRSFGDVLYRNAHNKQIVMTWPQCLKRSSEIILVSPPRRGIDRRRSCRWDR